MASVDTSTTEPTASRSRPVVVAASLSWALVACVLLGASGVVRVNQERRHQSDHAYREACPFPLSELPAQLGEWHLIKGSDKPLDAMTMRITGGSDHLVRTYANDLTGVSVVVLVLFGPAEPVLPHVPAICYPSSGFVQGDYDATRTIDFALGNGADGKPILGHALFQSASYMKPAGRNILREAVYHSFRLDGEWSPFIGSGRKFPRRNPGVFKIQVQRQVAEGEFLGAGDPIEQFLASLMAEIETKIKANIGQPKQVASKT